MTVCDTSDPVVLFRSVVAAINAGDWVAVAAACDPESLTRFRESALADVTEKSEPLTVETLVRMSPEMPVAVAEEIVEHAQRSGENREIRDNERRAEVLSVASVLTPEEFFARSIEGATPRGRIASLAASGELDALEVASAIELSPLELRVVVLGAVPDGDTRAQVVYRDAAGASLVDPGYVRWLDGLPEGGRSLYEELGGHRRISTETARRQPDGSWRLMASTELAGVDQLPVAYDKSSEPGTRRSMYGRL